MCDEQGRVVTTGLLNTFDVLREIDMESIATIVDDEAEAMRKDLRWRNMNMGQDLPLVAVTSNEKLNHVLLRSQWI